MDRRIVATFFAFSTAAVLLAVHPSLAARLVDLPIAMLKDNSDNVVGPVLEAGSSTIVLLRNPNNNEPIILTFAPDRYRSATELNLYYTNANCTGTPYILDPDSSGSASVRLLGSTYTAGPVNATVSLEPDLIFTNKFAAGTGTDNSGILGSRYRVGNLFQTPTCDTSVISSPTIEAEQVLDLSALNPPFRIE